MVQAPAPPPDDPLRGRTTELLRRIELGEEDAADELLPVVYEELRRLAAGYFQHESPGHTLQPTALVHEAFLKLVSHPGGDWKSRGHFMALAARAMRQVLIDHARSKGRTKRGGDLERVPLSSAESPSGEMKLDVLDLERALEKLAAIDPRQVRIIELWFFAGLTTNEVAEVLGVSERTVRREWRHARAWLNRELSQSDAP